MFDKYGLSANPQAGWDGIYNEEVICWVEER